MKTESNEECEGLTKFKDFQNINLDENSCSSSMEKEKTSFWFLFVEQSGKHMHSQVRMGSSDCLEKSLHAQKTGKDIMK